MSAKSRVKLKICGNEFIITSDDSEEYIRQTGELVEQRIQSLLHESESMSVSMAAVFAAMEFCDESVKSKETADNLRAQIKEYLEEASKARGEADEAHRRMSTMASEIQSLRARLLQKDNKR